MKGREPFNPGLDQRRSADLDMLGKVGSAKINGEIAWQAKTIEFKNQLCSDAPR